MTKTELMEMVARLIREKSINWQPPNTVQKLQRLLDATPDQIVDREWAVYLPTSVIYRWDELPDEFKLGILVAACCDPMGCTAGAGYQNDGH